MSKTLIKSAAVMAVSLALSLSAAAKDHGKAAHNGGWHDRDGWRVQRVADRDHDGRRGRDHDRNDWRRQGRRDHDRDDWRRHERRDTPAGWSHGKKTGWGDCNVPPGQAKKSGCGSYGYRRDAHRPVYSGHRTRGPVYVPPRTSGTVTTTTQPHGPIFTQSKTPTPTQSRPHGPIYTQRKTDQH
ncbi:MAG TPA: hypothetical protein VFU76_03375 [Terriglobales bacterium]|nr:hypothetical protein [Terriglobales bacterium]